MNPLHRPPPSPPPPYIIIAGKEIEPTVRTIDGIHEELHRLHPGLPALPGPGPPTPTAGGGGRGGAGRGFGWW